MHLFVGNVALNHLNIILLKLLDYCATRSPIKIPSNILQVIYGPRREKTCLRGGGGCNTGENQPAHLRSLISAFVIRILESIIFELAIDEITIF